MPESACTHLARTGTPPVDASVRAQMSWSQRPLPPDWNNRRRLVLDRDNHQCVECGARGTEVDHVVPRSEGGTDDLSNLSTKCVYHHRRKTAAEANRARKRKYQRVRRQEPHPGRIAG